MLVANAGVGGPDVVDGEDRFDEIVRTNLDGAYFCLRAFERHLAPGPEARHVVVSRAASLASACPASRPTAPPRPASSASCAPSRRSSPPRGVRVNAVCPGWVETRMAEDRMREIAAELGRDYDAVRRELLAGVPLQRISEPDEIAGLVEFLCSPDAAGFTGQAFDPNNGAWMG